MFASKSIVAHLARGAVGMGALAAAATQSEASPWLSLGLVAIALVALRGCPMCWTMGLAQTVVARWTRTPLEGTCIDGSCAFPGRRENGPVR